MTSLAQYSAAVPAMLLNMGNATAGKTGALLALLVAGYRLRVIDLDAQLGSLAYWARRAVESGLLPPEALEPPQFDCVTLTQPLTPGQQGKLSWASMPDVFDRALQLATYWHSDVLDDGWVRGWDDSTVLVIDSLMPLAEAALAVQQAINRRQPGFGNFANSYTEYGSDAGAAQDRLLIFLQHLRSQSVPCHVVVNAHFQQRATPELGLKHVPLMVGAKLAPRLASLFPYVVMTQATHVRWGPDVARVVRTKPTLYADLRVPAADITPEVLPIQCALPLILELSRGKPGPRGSCIEWAQGIINAMPPDAAAAGAIPAAATPAQGASGAPALSLGTVKGR